MQHDDAAAGLGHGQPIAGEAVGRFALHQSLPWAVRSLDDAELRTLLVALLQEWRDRAELSEGPI